MKIQFMYFQKRNWVASVPISTCIHVSVSDLYIPMIDLPILQQEICGPILEIYINRSQTHVEIGTEAAQFPEKEYINGIFVAVYNMHSLFY
jgi:hypothetical protein